MDNYRTVFGSDEHSSIAQIYKKIGSIHNNLGQYDLAFQNLDIALKIARPIFVSDEHPLIASILKNINLVKSNLA